MFEFRLAKILRNKRIKSISGDEIEPHEVFLDNLAKKKEEELGITEKRFEVPLSKRIFQGILFLSLAAALVLYGKTFQLQYLENKKFVALAQENKFIFHSIQATRGVIYDSKDEQLVFNKISFDLVLNKEKLPESNNDRDRVMKEMAMLIKQDSSILKNRIETSQNETILIAEKLDQQTLVLLETKINDLPGFEIQQNAVRDYKDGKTFAQVIGYTSRVTGEELREQPDAYSLFDYAGRTGVEKTYEDFLRKKPGKVQIERDARGNQISKQIISLPEPGKSLVLWLDAGLQKKAETALAEILQATNSKSGVAVAMDPRNGGVLAMVSLPGFDNNLFTKGNDPVELQKLLTDKNQALLNRAIGGQFPTGSIVKPLEAAAALEEKIISPSKFIDCQGKITIPHRYNPEIVYEYNDWTTHSLTDMKKAIAESCDVYFYTIGGGYGNQKGLGPTRIKKYLELFGWANDTGIDLPGEVKGFIPSPEWKQETRKEGWWDGDTYNLSIGQGDMSITPLQVATSFCAIANGGTLWKPQVVQKIINNETGKAEEIQPQIIRKDFINPENISIAREGMRRAVTGEGSPQASSVILNSLPIKVAAKTGTAQTSRKNYYDNWVTVFAPYDNPQIVLTVMIEHVENAQVAALPVAKNILEWYFTEH